MLPPGHIEPCIKNVKKGVWSILETFRSTRPVPVKLNAFPSWQQSTSCLVPPSLPSYASGRFLKAHAKGPGATHNHGLHIQGVLLGIVILSRAEATPAYL